MNTPRFALSLALAFTFSLLVACDGGDPAGSGSAGTGGEDVTGGGGGSTEPIEPEAPVAPPCNAAADVTGAAVTGLVYRDEDASDVSRDAMGFDAEFDTLLGGETINLLTWGAVEWTATTCEGGDFGFGNLADGTYLVEPALGDRGCQSRNCPRRLAEAVRSGSIKLVTMGDSVPLVGDKPTFPDRLAGLLGGLATVDNRNIAVGGTLSTHWLPGTSYCENSLLPEVADADVLVISLGGNDILDYVNSAFSGGGLGGDLVGDAMNLVIVIMENVMATVGAVREVNPDIDIVYCLYPNYGEATGTYPWSLVGDFLGKETMIQLLDTARDAIPYGSGLILADMYAGFDGLPLDDYLYDMLHFNHAGATLYAEIIFQSLGGVFVGESPLPPHGLTPLGAIHDFGLSP